MFSPAYRKSLATALAAAALASATTVSNAFADQHAIDAAAREAAGMQSTLGEEYQDLRSPDAIDAARAAVDPPKVVTSSQDLRSPDTRDYASDYAPSLEPQPVVDEPSTPGGFDWVSALIGAAAAAALALALMAIFGVGRPVGRRPASA